MAVIAFLPKDFSYVILCVLYTIFVNIYLAMKVGKARKLFGVKYPDMYSDKSAAFNCIQRAHQNFLEGVPLFLVQLLLVGFACPKYAAICGAIYMTSRFSYAWGYYTGDPQKRMNGNYGYLGFFGLFFGLIYVAVRQCECMDAYFA